MVKTVRGRARLGPVLRAVIETGFIIFLFYSNLLMGEFRTLGDGAEEGHCVGNRRCFYRR